MIFSVVITVYNKEPFIQETLKSVLNQDFHSFEILVINDGSTDNSLTEINNVNDSRIKVITTPNQGVSKARNTGIENAKGKYIAFLDGDDLWKKNHLTYIHQLIVTFPKEHVFATSLIHKKNNKLHYCKYSVGQKQQQVIDYFAGSHIESLLHPSTTALSKEAINNIGLFNTKYSNGEDTEYWFRVGLKYKVAFHSQHTAIRTFSTGSLSQKKIVPENYCFFEAFDQFRTKNKELSLFLNRNLYALALDCKKSGFDKIAKNLILRIDKQLLTKTQKLFLACPKTILNLLFRIKTKLDIIYKIEII